AGPGVSDDGAGVAVVLELARAFSAKTTRNDVIFLITDGEETGLRGARAFAERHPLMRRVGVVVNFEARGASGPSMMFETGPGNARLMDLFAHAVARPSASSVSYEVYKLLPNDTDFSVYRKLGLSGFNFAFSNSASLYHSARDNLQYIDRRSLQHAGEHAFEVAGSRVDARALLLVNWAVLALLALGVALTIGGASYPFLWPVFGVAIAGWIETLVRKRAARSLCVTALAGFVLVAFFLLTFLL